MEIDEAYLKKLVDDMIRIDTSNGKENDLVFFLENEFRSLGLKPIIQDVEDNRSNIYAINEWSDDGPFYTFNFHLDTVPVCHGWKTDPLNPHYESDGLVTLLGFKYL